MGRLIKVGIVVGGFIIMLISPRGLSAERVADELPELIVESRGKRLLHVLAYVREYSSLSTLTDTISLFREKMVDFMMPLNRKVSMRGWLTPRILNSKSYYRFTNAEGLDSVSDEHHNHFSWADWVGIPELTPMPVVLSGLGNGTETVGGKFSPREVWRKDEDIVNVSIDVLADREGSSWVPGISRFLTKDIDFNHLKISYNYENVIGSYISPLDLSGYSFSIGSTGRGHDMFRFNKYYEDYYVTTDAEVYILDREVITEKEAREWERMKFDIDEIGIYEPQNIPAPSPEVIALIERVNKLDKSEVRMDYQPDERLMRKHDGQRNFQVGRRALFILKDAVGYSKIKHRRDQKNRWKKFKRERLENNDVH